MSAPLLLLALVLPASAQDEVRKALDAARKNDSGVPAVAAPKAGALRSANGCLMGMMPIDPSYCIDKWEASVVDKKTGAPASPYHVLGNTNGYGGARWQQARWKAKPSRDDSKYPLPDLPAAHASPDFEPMAVTKPGVYPQGFASYATAKLACENAGKRLCTRDEWYKACAGSKAAVVKGTYGTAFPYGPKYEKGKCNFNLLTGNLFTMLGRTSSELDDPRFMIAASGGRRYLAKTGEYDECQDKDGYGVMDMVGNQDEIVADDGNSKAEMTFVGSFYSRWQKGGPLGCASAIKSHGKGYFDYSIGFRCCAQRKL
jgi:sulfatase modifying factor 1